MGHSCSFISDRFIRNKHSALTYHGGREAFGYTSGLDERARGRCRRLLSRTAQLGLLLARSSFNFASVRQFRRRAELDKYADTE
ncbi:Hypothetical protein NTJ_05583 [Nesidiocoris tenuis]|uniref:Uncharacterized protein n=1 Tax=Nesidiocoris tenuis TaxID=355587 RepID=A0ABN7AKJ8_9HEMI|nr:Hypothetical protein NTJ_05583 [Nesidiocoris tenuis]